MTGTTPLVTAERLEPWPNALLRPPGRLRGRRKTTRIAVALAVLLATGGAVSGCGIAGPRRTASGQVASRHLEAAGATHLDVAYGFQVAVHIGQPEAVTVTYDESLADLLDVGVDGGRCGSSSNPTAPSAAGRPCAPRSPSPGWRRSGRPAPPPSPWPTRSADPACGSCSPAAAG